MAAQTAALSVAADSLGVRASSASHSRSRTPGSPRAIAIPARSRDRAAGGEAVAAGPQVGQRGLVRLRGRVEIAGAGEGDGQQDRRRAAQGCLRLRREPGRDELAREARLRDRRGAVPFEPGELRAEERELRRDRRPHHRAAVATVGERPLGVGQPLGHALGLAGEDEAPGVRRAELGMAADDLRRQGVEPPPHGAQLARVDVPARGDRDDPARALEIARSEGVVDRLVVIALLLVPGRRSRVQLGDLVGMERPQPGAEDLGEERVVAIPAPLVVERDDQEVRALQLLEPRLAVALRR